MIERIRREDCVLVVIDVQEKFMKVLDDVDTLLGNIVKLTMSANEFNVPLIVTEQNPEGLGKTVDQIYDFLGPHDYFSKSTFSCFGNEPFKEKIRSLGRKQIILTGIETQVCIVQTALDALEEGMEVFVVADAVTSRKASDREIALERMRQAGAIVECAEGVMFYLLEDCNDEKFKKLQWIIKSF